MPGLSAFQYTILRVVPRIERGECMNVGVVLFCPERRFIGVRIALDEARLSAFAPGLDPGTIRAPLDAIAAVLKGDSRGGSAGAAQRVGTVRVGGGQLLHRDPALGGAHGADR